MLLTLGTTDDDGIILGHNGDVDVGGHVWSNSKIDLSNPTHMVMNGGRVWAWGSCNRPGNIEMAPGVSPICNASTNPLFGGVKPKVALDPADPSLGHVADWQPAAAPASLVAAGVPRVRVEQDDAATRRLLQRRRVLRQDERVRRRHAEPGRLLPRTSRPATTSGSLDTNVTGACDASGQGVQIVFADSAHVKLSGTLTIPCGRSATAERAADRSVRPEDRHRPERTVHDHAATVRAADADRRHVLERRVAGATCSRRAAPPIRRTARTRRRRSPATTATSELTIGSFARDHGPALTTKATVSSVVVKVAHDETAGVNFQSATALKWGSCTVPLTPSRSSTATMYTSANLASQLTNCGFDQMPRVVWNLKRSGNRPTDTLHVDGAQIDVTWSQPGRAGAERLCRQGARHAGYCPLMSPPSNGKGNMVVQAVVYIPNNMFAGQVQQHRQLQDRHRADRAHARRRHQPEPRRFAGHRRGHAASHQR